MPKLINKISNLIPMCGIWLQRKSILLKLLEKKGLTLDLGCGDGYFTDLLKRKDNRVVSVDIDKKNIIRNSLFIIADAQDLPFKSHIFDQIVLTDVLEHIQNDKKSVEDIDRILKKNGSIALTIPTNNFKFPRFCFMRYVCPSEKWLMNSFGHVRNGYKLEEIEELFNNFSIERKIYFVNKIGELMFDLEYSKLYVLKNIFLKGFALPLFINFNISKKGSGAFLGIKLIKK